MKSKKDEPSIFRTAAIFLSFFAALAAMLLVIDWFIGQGWLAYVMIFSGVLFVIGMIGLTHFYIVTGEK